MAYPPFHIKAQCFQIRDGGDSDADEYDVFVIFRSVDEVTVMLMIMMCLLFQIRDGGDSDADDYDVFVIFRSVMEVTVMLMTMMCLLFSDP